MPQDIETASNAATTSDTNEFDVIVVGAGFSGMYLLHKLRGLGFSVHVIDKASDVGGTWYWNRYPGARCDIDSLDYSYSFDDDLQQEWHWPERYSAQPDILRYARHVADRFDLRRDMELDTEVTAATWDEGAARWTVETDTGKRYSAPWFVMATGCLSVPRMPDIAGLEDFEGPWYHTGEWPHEEIDFTGMKVGVIGTGSSGIQSIPQIVKQAEHVTVFQRTPNFSMPAWNGPIPPEREKAHKARYAEYREIAKWSQGGYLKDENDEPMPLDRPDYVREQLERRWAEGGFSMLNVFNDVMSDHAANEVATAFVHEKIKEMVDDPETAELLCPKNHPLGTKRLCVDTGYYEVYNRDNISLLDINATPIERITAKGIKTSEKEYAFDAIVFATGFDAMTGALLAVDIRGRDGISLRDKWREGPKSYLGLTVVGFPNFFMITGPGSPSVLTNMMTAIEQHVEWVSDCVKDLRDRQVARMEPTAEAETRWVAHVNEEANKTLYPEAASWYLGANIPGKPRVFMPYTGGQGTYRKICDDVVARDYEGFELGR